MRAGHADAAAAAHAARSGRSERRGARQRRRERRATGGVKIVQGQMAKQAAERGQSRRLWPDEEVARVREEGERTSALCLCH